MQKIHNRGYIYLGITIILLSTYEVVCRTLVGKISPIQVSFIRFFFGGVVLLPAALLDIKQRKVSLSKKDLIKVALLGVLLVDVSMNLLQYGLNQTRANLAATIFSSNPLFVALTATLLLNEPLNIRKILSLGMGFAGVALIFYGSGNNDTIYYYGLIYLLFAALTFGIYTVLGKKITMRIGSLAMNSLSFIFGSIILIPFLLFQHQPIFSISMNIWPQMLYISIFVTGLAYYTYFKGLALTDTSLGSMVFFVKPPLACFLAAKTLGEEVTLNLVLGTTIVLASIYTAQQ